MRKDVPKKYHKLTLKLKSSRKDSIKLFCLECCGYEPGEVKLCTDKDCPLYHWRLKG